ncbi:MAG TPA: helix-turn-helix domain-containing protein [Acidimicrobiales bacterium]
MGRPGLDPGTLGLKEGSDQYLRSRDVEKVLSNRKTRSLMSAWFNGIRLVRGIKRGIFEERKRIVSLIDITAIARRTQADVTARRTNLDEQLAKENYEAVLSSSNAPTNTWIDLLNENRSVVSDVVSAPMLLLTVVDAARLLAVSRTKLYELLNSRSIDSVYIGHSRRIRLVDLEAFVDGLNTTS